MKKIAILCLFIFLMFIASAKAEIVSPNVERFCNGKQCIDNIYASSQWDIDPNTGKYKNITDIIKMSFNYSTGDIKYSYSDDYYAIARLFFVVNVTQTVCNAQSWNWFDNHCYLWWSQAKTFMETNGIGYNVVINKHPSMYKYALNLTSIPQTYAEKILYIGMHLEETSENINWNEVTLEDGNVMIKNKVALSYGDLIQSGYTLNLYDKRTILIGNVTNKSNLWLDPITTIKANDTNAKCYNAQDVNLPPTFLNPGFPFFSADYLAVGASDDSRATQTGAAGTKYPLFRFNFTLPAYTTVNWIFFSYEGQSSAATLEWYIYFWDISDSSWEQKLFYNVVSAATDYTVTYNETGTVNITDSINTTDNTVEIIVEGDDKVLSSISVDYAYLQVSYVFNTAPSIESLIEPTDPSTYSSGASYIFNATINDPDLVADISTVLFEFNSTGSTLANNTVTVCSNINTTAKNCTFTKSDLGVGVYSYKWYANDSQNEWASSSSATFTISKATPSFSTSVTSPITYETASDYSGSESNSVDTDCNYTLYRNGTAIATGSSVSDNTILGYEAYNYTYAQINASCTNYTTGSDAKTLTVNQKDASVVLSPSNGTITYETSSNEYCTENTLLTCNVYRNGTLITNDTTEYLPAGYWEFKANISDSTNYTNYQVLQNVTVEKKNANVQVFPLTSTQVYPHTATQYCTDDSSLLNCAIYRDGASITNNTEYSPSVGTYVYVANITDSTNYTNPTDTETLITNKGALSGTATCTESTITYPSTPECSYSESNSGDTDVVYKFYYNETEITSPFTTRLGVGYYLFKLNTTGDTFANWTANASISTSGLTVNQGTSVVDVYLDNITSNKTVTFPVVVEVRGNSTTVITPPTFNLYVSSSTTSGNPSVISTTEGVGTYNVVYNTSGNANWTSASNSTLYLIVGINSSLTNNMNILFNGTSNQNKTKGYDSVGVNITGNYNSSSALTFNLYNSTTLLSSGTTATNVTTLGIGEHKFIYNTSGNANYSSASLTYYVSVWNTTEGSVGANSSVSLAEANTNYNISFRAEVIFSNPASWSDTINYNYTIPATFTPYNVQVKNSSNLVISNNISGNVANWTTETVGSIDKTEVIYWTCMNCVNDTETVITYNTGEYNKNVSLTSLVSGYNITVTNLKIDVPNSYDRDDFNIAVTRNDTTMTYTVTYSGDLYDYITLSNQVLSSGYVYNVHITSKPTSPGTPGGGTGGGGGGGGGAPSCAIAGSVCSEGADCCGGLACDIPANATVGICVTKLISVITTDGEGVVNFDVSPTYLQPDPLITTLIPGSTIAWKIKYFNYEVENSLIPAFEFLCPVASTCMKDWCTLTPAIDDGYFTTGDGVPPLGEQMFNLVCVIPQDAQLNTTYRTTLLFWAEGFDKNNSKPVSVQVRPSTSVPILGGAEAFAREVKDSLLGVGIVAKEILNYPIICFSKTCSKDALATWDRMEKPSEIRLGQVALFEFDAFRVYHVMIFILLFIVWKFTPLIKGLLNL